MSLFGSSKAMRSQRSENTVTQSTDVALPSDYETGLEDFDPSQALLPRITIDHPNGVFKDSLTNEEFPVMTGVMLGLIKQRVMWEKDQQDDSKPQCKSNDGDFGYPNITGPQHSLFPWAQSGIADPNALTRDEHGRPIIKCETCPFAQWRKNGAKNEPPPCSERYTIPILFSPSPEGGPLDHAGILSFQRSGIAPVKAFISGFARTKVPLFSAYAQLKLKRLSRGTVAYSVPEVKRLGPTDQANYEEYAREYRGVRELLRMAPRFEQPEPVAAPQSNAWNPAPASQPTQPAWPQPGPVATTAAPVQAQVIQPAPVVVQPTVQQPVQPAVIVTPPAAAPSVTVSGTGIIDAASTPVTSTTAVPNIKADDDDDLPF